MYTNTMARRRSQQQDYNYNVVARSADSDNTSAVQARSKGGRAVDSGGKGGA